MPPQATKPAPPETAKRSRNDKPEGLSPIAEAAWAEKRLAQIGKRYVAKFDSIEAERQLAINGVRSSLSVEALRHLDADK